MSDYNARMLDNDPLMRASMLMSGPLKSQTSKGGSSGAADDDNDSYDYNDENQNQYDYEVDETFNDLEANFDVSTMEIINDENNNNLETDLDIESYKLVQNLRNSSVSAPATSVTRIKYKNMKQQQQQLHQQQYQQQQQQQQYMKRYSNVQKPLQLKSINKYKQTALGAVNYSSKNQPIPIGTGKVKQLKFYDDEKFNDENEKLMQSTTTKYPSSNGNSNANVTNGINKSLKENNNDTPIRNTPSQMQGSYGYERTGVQGNDIWSKILIIISYIFLVISFPFSLCACVKVAQEYERAVVFRLGRIIDGGHKGPGIFFVLPCVDTYLKVDLRTVTFDVPPQEILTKDSVTVSVDAVVYFRIFNAVISVINVEDAAKSTKLLAASTLRNVLGTKSLHEILSDRETVATLIQNTLLAATSPWGVQVERVEVKDVRLPVQLQRAMATEAEAAREARAKVIAAEGEKKASVALKEAAAVINQSPIAIQLRYLQTLTQIASEKNSTIVFPIPLELISNIQGNRRQNHNHTNNNQTQQQISSTITALAASQSSSSSALPIQMMQTTTTTKQYQNETLSNINTITSTNTTNNNNINNNQQSSIIIPSNNINGSIGNNVTTATVAHSTV